MQVSLTWFQIMVAQEVHRFLVVSLSGGLWSRDDLGSTVGEGMVEDSWSGLLWLCVGSEGGWACALMASLVLPAPLDAGVSGWPCHTWLRGLLPLGRGSACIEGTLVLGGKLGSRVARGAMLLRQDHRWEPTRVPVLPILVLSGAWRASGQRVCTRAFGASRPDRGLQVEGG